MALYFEGRPGEGRHSAALGIGRDEFHAEFLDWAGGQVRDWGLDPSPSLDELADAVRADPRQPEALAEARRERLPRISSLVAGGIGEPAGTADGDTRFRGSPPRTGPELRPAPDQPRRRGPRPAARRESRSPGSPRAGPPTSDRRGRRARRDVGDRSARSLRRRPTGRSLSAPGAGPSPPRRGTGRRGDSPSDRTRPAKREGPGVALEIARQARATGDARRVRRGGAGGPDERLRPRHPRTRRLVRGRGESLRRRPSAHRWPSPSSNRTSHATSSVSRRSIA